MLLGSDGATDRDNTERNKNRSLFARAIGASANRKRSNSKLSHHTDFLSKTRRNACLTLALQPPQLRFSVASPLRRSSARPIQKNQIITCPRLLLTIGTAAQSIAQHCHRQDPIRFREDVEGYESAVIQPAHTPTKGRTVRMMGTNRALDDGLAAVLFRRRRACAFMCSRRNKPANWDG